MQGFEHAAQVGATEVRVGFQAGEHALPAGQFLEMLLADIQHGGAQVEVLEELRDKDVNGDHSLRVYRLHFLQDVEQPLEVTLTSGDPDEIQLLTPDLVGALDGGHVHEVL